MATVQDQIAAKVKTNLLAITPGNGYSFDIDGRVYEWRRVPETDIWSISFYDTTDENDDGSSLQNELDYVVVLSGAGGSTTAQNLRGKMQDIITAFALILNETFVDDASYNGSEKEMDHEEKKIGEVNLNFTVVYKTDRWKI